MAHKESTARLGAVTVGIAPLALLGAFMWHPHIPGRLPNNAAIGDAVAADVTGWGLAHLAAAGASAILILAFLVVRNYLRDAGEDRWSAFGLPFVIVGSVLFAVLPGMEFAPLAAVEAGADPAAAQAALEPWFLPVLLTGAVMFAIGLLGFARALTGSRILGGATGLVVVALVIMAASRFVPVAAVQLYVQGVAALVALLPLAFQIGNHPVPAAAVPQRA